MTNRENWKAIRRLFLDTAPVIYYVEGNPRYSASLATIFARLDNGTLTAVTSPVTLAECLVIPYRLQETDLIQSFTDLITGGNGTLFAPIDHEAAQSAAELRARYNLTLTDAFQIAIALAAGCDAFLTNDFTLRRIADIRILVLDEMEAQRGDAPEKPTP